MEPFERTLPHNLEAERALLGAVLLYEHAFAEAAELLTAGQFFRDAHRRIFAQLCQLSVQGVGIDLVTLKDALAGSGQLDEVGGPGYLASLIEGVPRSTNVANHARIIREKHALRDVIYAANKMLSRAYDAEDGAHDVVEEAEKMIFKIAEGSAKTGFVRVGEMLPRLLEKLEGICRSKQNVTGVATGFADLDDLTRGLQPGNLIIVGARPSMGKTSLAINIADHVAGQGLHVGVFSLEMSSEELMVRELASGARIDSYRLQSGYLGERDWPRLSQAMERLWQSRLYLDETPNIGVFEMHAKARRLKAEYGLDLLIVDYLQLMGSTVQDRKVENRTLELGAITRGLKILARELQIPVVALSQLSRGVDGRTDKRPILSDLRDSGSIEQDADLVLFLYRDEMYHKDRADMQGVAEVIIAKHRNGPIGTVKLSFVREYTRFENMAPAYQADDQLLPMGDR